MTTEAAGTTIESVRTTIDTDGMTKEAAGTNVEGDWDGTTI